MREVTTHRIHRRLMRLFGFGQRWNVERCRLGERKKIVQVSDEVWLALRAGANLAETVRALRARFSTKPVGGLPPFVRAADRESSGRNAACQCGSGRKNKRCHRWDGRIRSDIDPGATTVVSTTRGT